MHTNQIAIAFAWGLLVLLSLIGWGDLVGRWVDRDARFDSGLCASWGVAVVLFFGGILNASRLCGYSAVIAIVLGGLVSFVIRWLRHHRRAFPFFNPAYLPLALMLLAVYLTSVAWMPFSNWNLYDDYPAYLTYPIKMLQTGAADDPFSLRRIATLGGPAFLQAVACFPMWPRSAFIVDMGLGNILCCLLIVGYLRRRRVSALLATAPCLLLLLLPLGRINTMFIMLGIAGFLALFMTLSLAAESEKRVRVRLHVVVGAIATGLVTLRPNFIPAVGLVILLSACLAGFRTLRAWREIVYELFVSAAVAAVCLLPWSIALYRSSGSFLWPLMHGNEQRRFNITSAHLPLWPEIGFIAFFYLQPLVALMVGLGVLAIRAGCREAIALWLAALAGSLATTALFTLSDYPNLTRYSLPPMAAAAIASLLCTQRGPPDDRLRRFGRAIMVVLLAIAVLLNLQSPLLFETGYRSLHNGVWNDAPLVSDDLAAKYSAAQSHIPVGATVLTLTSYPFLFDFARNRIDCADMPGMASPRAAMPYHEGPSALSAYLIAHGIDWIVCEDFDANAGSSYCNRSFWNNRLTNERFPIDRVYADAMLDFMNSIDQIAPSAKQIYSSDGLRAIRLR